MWKDQVSNNEDLQKRFLALEGDFEKEKAFMRDWASEQFGDELLDQGLLFQSAGDSLNKWLDGKELQTRDVT